MLAWWLWILVMLLLLVPPIGYGWAYRGWGPPYPLYVQRRRGQRTVVADGSVPFDHQSWGLGGDFVWAVFFIGILWAIGSFWWR